MRPALYLQAKSIGTHFCSLIAVLCCCLTGVYAQNKDQQALQAAVQSKNWPEIETILSRLKVSASSDASMLSLYTLSLMQQEKADAALPQAARLLEIDSNRMQSWLMLAECYSRKQRSEDCIGTLQRASLRFRDSLQTQWALGLAYAKFGRYQDAIAPLEDVMFRRSDPSIMYELARCYFKTAQYNAAAEINELLVERFPNNAAYQTASGESQLAVKNFSKAISHLEEAVRLDTTTLDALLLLTGALQESGDSAKALATAEVAVRRNAADPMAWYNLGLLRMHNRQFDSASKALKRALTLRPSYGEAYFNLAVVYEQKGFIEDAVNAFKRCAIVSSALAPDAYNSLAIMYRRNGNLPDALTAHEQAIALRDTSSALHVSRLNSCFEAEKCELATGFIDQALQRFPQQPQVLYAVSRCLLRIGRRDEAAQHIMVLEKIDPVLAEQLKTMMRL